MATNGVGFGSVGGSTPSVGTPLPVPPHPVVASGPGPGMMVAAPTGLAAGPHSVASASVAASPRAGDSRTKFQDEVVHWAVLERLGARPEINTVPDEATARRLYDEFTALAREQAPTEPHRWPQLLSGRITWTEVE